jgi:putative ABC transport system permease protein
MGLTLIAKVYFEQSYNDFIPSRERIYMIQSNYTRGEEETREFRQTSGGVAVGMKDMIPEVELATRYLWLGAGASFTDEDKNRYASYIKLTPGATPESIRPGVDRTREKYLDRATLQQAGVEIDYSFIPLTEIHTSGDEVRQTMWLLGIMAFALLLTAVMNYLLIVISSLVNRSKEMAVHKCYGASEGNL